MGRKYTKGKKKKNKNSAKPNTGIKTETKAPAKSAVSIDNLTPAQKRAARKAKLQQFQAASALQRRKEAAVAQVKKNNRPAHQELLDRGRAQKDKLRENQRELDADRQTYLVPAEKALNEAKIAYNEGQITQKELDAAATEYSDAAAYIGESATTLEQTREMLEAAHHSNSNLFKSGDLSASTDLAANGYAAQANEFGVFKTPMDRRNEEAVAAFFASPNSEKEQKKAPKGPLDEQREVRIKDLDLTEFNLSST